MFLHFLPTTKSALRLPPSTFDFVLQTFWLSIEDFSIAKMVIEITISVPSPSLLPGTPLPFYLPIATCFQIPTRKVTKNQPKVMPKTFRM
jgi:hypothetical protein